MSFIRPTGGFSSPFATSTAFSSTGATAYSQSWITVDTTGGRYRANLSNNTKGIGMTALQSSSGTSRFYWRNHNVYPQSAHAYYTSFQTYAESTDEIIAKDNQFVVDNVTANTVTARTNIIRVEL